MRRNIIVFLAILTLLPLARGFAQEGRIIYTEFNPALSITDHLAPYDSIKLDIDRDGRSDVSYWIRVFKTSQPKMALAYDWDARLNECPDTIWGFHPYYQGGVWYNIWDIGHYDIQGGYEHFTISEEWLFRKSVDGHYYYGWAHLQCIDSGYYLSYVPYEIFKYTIQIDRMAYCTIPDYVLQWGQTSFEDVEEHGENVFAVHPNPSQGLVSVRGGRIAEARLYSVMGQLVATKRGNGTEDLTMDITGLPSGLYFVTVINEDGQKAVKKIIKE